MTTITYRATNQRNGKWYVGSTLQDLKNRIKEHKKCKTRDPFHNSLRKHPDEFEWEVLSEVEGEDRSHEQEVLDGWYGTPYCYNVSSVSSGWCPRIASEMGKMYGPENVKKIPKESLKLAAQNMNRHPGTLDNQKEQGKRNKNGAENGRKSSSKPVECVETGQKWPSAHAASRETNIPRSSITNSIAYPNRTAGGHHWKLAQ